MFSKNMKYGVNKAGDLIAFTDGTIEGVVEIDEKKYKEGLMLLEQTSFNDSVKSSKLKNSVQLKIIEGIGRDKFTDEELGAVGIGFADLPISGNNGKKGDGIEIS